MKLPQCLACFGGCTRPASENDSSHFSVSKGPGPSGTVVGRFLSSFMSRRSCSGGTWDCSSTDKPRVRPRGDADVVTLATARYLELFATTPRNDETSTVLSEAREAQDSLRSARTASEHQAVSRSSTFTGRASRELSRLGPSQQQQQAGPPATLPASGSQRFSVPGHRRGASESMPSAASPGKDAARKTGSASHVTAQSPFTNKTRASCLAASRCRSDRISPSTAAYLLPAPSARAIARAHTAIIAGSAGMSSSTSFNELCSVPADMGDCGADSSNPAGGSGGVRPREHASAAATHIMQTQADGGKHGPVGGRRSRLHTESGGPAGAGMQVGGVAAAGAGGAAAAAAASPHSDLGAAAHEWVQNHNQLARSNTLGRGNGRRPLPRRPSILFSRDGEVTVTGLPPSCLTAGRAPRCRAIADMGRSPSMLSTGACSTMTADVSAPILCSALLVAGGSVDSSGARNGRGVGGGGDGGGPKAGARARRNSSGCMAESSSPRLSLASRSNDPGSRGGAGGGTSMNTNASAVGLSVSRMQPKPVHHHHLYHHLNGGGGRDRGMCTGVSVSCGVNAVFTSTDATSDRRQGCAIRSTQHCGGEGGESAEQFQGFGEDEPVQQRSHQQHQQQQQQEQQHQQQQHQQEGVDGERSERMGQACPDGQLRAGPEGDHNKRLERVRQQLEAVGPQVLSLANSSSEGQRCDWAGSSMYTPSRFSDSSRLTHGLTGPATATATPVTASVHSNNPLLEACVTAIAAAAAAVPASLPAPQASTTAADSPASDGAVPSAITASAAAEGDDEVAVGPAGPNPPTGLLPGGSLRPSLLATEARDVTSALNRLQEACLAAVAQGDMRSQRLCRRMSTELPWLCPDLTSALMRIGDGGDGRSLASGGGGLGGFDGAERCSSVGPLSVTANLGGVPGRRAGVRTRPSFGPSASLPRMAAASVQASLQAQALGGGGGISQDASVTLAMGCTLEAAAEGAEVDAGGVPWGGDRPTPDGAGIIIDGAVLQRARFSAADAVGKDPGDAHGQDSVAGGGGGSGAGPSVAAPTGGDAFDDPGEEYRNRVLNVLLRSDFLHDTFEAGSEDDDDGVVEYRYGGFELGGGDNDCGFARQASFMEAVRKCGTAKAAAAAVGLDPSQAEADMAGAGGPFRSALLPVVAAGLSRHGPPNGATLTRMASCLAAAAVASPVP